MDDRIEVRISKIADMGVFALKSFEIGEEIIRYPRGRFVSKNQVKDLSDQDRDHLDVVDEDTYEIMTEPARFVNHSCGPNTIEKVTTESIISYALLPIKKGEELTVDYRIRSKDGWRLKCNCGANNCTGEIIGDFFSLSKTLQIKYLQYVPAFISAKYNKRNEK